MISSICAKLVTLCMAGLLGGFVWLLVCVFTKRKKKPCFVVCAACVGGFVVFTLIGSLSSPATLNNPSSEVGETQSGTHQDGRKEADTGDVNVENISENSDLVVEGETIKSFYRILEEIGIDAKDAKKIEKVEDWASGPRYSFPTNGTTARVYCSADGTVQSIKVGMDIDLYKNGYEPWKIENFIVDGGIKDTLIFKTKDAVSIYLNYPSSADFPLMDWSFGRQFDRYTVRSHVDAPNAFGVYSEVSFTAGYHVEDNTAELIYLEVGGNVVQNNADKYPLPERKEAETEGGDAMSAGAEIRIVDGAVGEYGEKMKLDNYEYIWYMVPAGKYKATGNAKNSIIYIDKNSVSKNAEGYAEVQNVSTYTLAYGESAVIEVGTDEHIFNTFGADFTLLPMK